MKKGFRSLVIKFFLEAGKNLECQVMMERTLNSRDNHAHTGKRKGCAASKTYVEFTPNSSCSSGCGDLIDLRRHELRGEVDARCGRIYGSKARSSARVEGVRAPLGSCRLSRVGRGGGLRVTIPSLPKTMQPARRHASCVAMERLNGMFAEAAARAALASTLPAAAMVVEDGEDAKRERTRQPPRRRRGWSQEACKRTRRRSTSSATSAWTWRKNPW